MLELLSLIISIIILIILVILVVIIAYNNVNNQQLNKNNNFSSPENNICPNTKDKIIYYGTKFKCNNKSKTGGGHPICTTFAKAYSTCENLNLCTAKEKTSIYYSNLYCTGNNCTGGNAHTQCLT